MIEPGMLLQNRYRVTEQIGHGGMGAVFVATDERFRSTVAIKQTFFDDPSLRKAFEREAHLLNHLRHAALPKVSDHFTEESGQFLVMEFIEGHDLSELLQQREGGAFPLADVLAWADELLDALDYLHTHEPPVVHRDIKPQNLKLTTRGRIVLLDFGLAKGSPTQTHTAAHTNASVFGYSRNYAPLEQMQGTGTDPRSDLYSLGATLYHMLTGAAPVDALTRASALVNNQPDPLRPAHLAHPQIPKVVSDLLHRAMAQTAAHRYATAAEMRAALRLASARTQQQHGVMTPEQSSLLDATVVGNTSVSAQEGRARSDSAAHAARVTSAQPQPATVMSETTIVDGRPRAPRRATAVASSNYSATGLYQPEPPARKSHKLAVCAVVALLVACASVPVLLSRRSAGDNKPAAQAEPSPLAPGTFQTDPAQPANGGVTQGLSSPSATTTADTQNPSARTSGDAPAQTTQPAQTSAAPNGTSATTGATGDGAINSSPTDTGRSGLVINAPAPANYQTPSDASRAAAAAEEEARRAEDARRAQERPRYPEGDRPPPPDGRRPPPPDGRRPPPPHHPRP